jgi:hypothetical protein
LGCTEISLKRPSRTRCELSEINVEIWEGFVHCKLVAIFLSMLLKHAIISLAVWWSKRKLSLHMWVDESRHRCLCC